jgi:YHYH protein
MKNRYPVLIALFYVLPLLSSADDFQRVATAGSPDSPAEVASLLFAGSSVIVRPDLVDCTLSKGTQTRCISITINPTQATHTLGPWCPRHISDGADKAGIWIDNDKVYDADGAFIASLADFYRDSKWQLFDPDTGVIKVTDSREACLAAARPDVDPAYQNYCVQCLPSYIDSAMTVTYLIPANPVPLAGSERVNPHGGIGLAFSGVKFDAPAPVDAILGAHTLAPFDDCGGHVNPHAGYHYHAVTDCAGGKDSVGDHATVIGYALDGYRLYSQLNLDGKEPDDLDDCRGHEFGDLGYHYHVNGPGKNQILACFRGEQGCAMEAGRQTCEVTGRPPPPPRG